MQNKHTVKIHFPFQHLYIFISSQSASSKTSNLDDTSDVFKLSQFSSNGIKVKQTKQVKLTLECPGHIPLYLKCH